MSRRAPLALIAIGADAGRLRQALILGRAEIALGGEARLLAQGESVMLFRTMLVLEEDERWQAVGEPTLAELIDEAIGDGVEIALCQTSVAMMGLTPEAFHPAIDYAGPVAFLAGLGASDRLVVV